MRPNLQPKIYKSPVVAQQLYHMYATTRYNFVHLKATHKISPLEELVGGRSPPPSSSQRLTGMVHWPTWYNTFTLHQCCTLHYFRIWRFPCQITGTDTEVISSSFTQVVQQDHNSGIIVWQTFGHQSVIWNIFDNDCFLKI